MLWSEVFLVDGLAFSQPVVSAAGITLAALVYLSGLVTLIVWRPEKSGIIFSSKSEWRRDVSPNSNQSVISDESSPPPTHDAEKLSGLPHDYSPGPNPKPKPYDDEPQETLTQVDFKKERWRN